MTKISLAKGRSQTVTKNRMVLHMRKASNCEYYSVDRKLFVMILLISNGIFHFNILFISVDAETSIRGFWPHAQSLSPKIRGAYVNGCYHYIGPNCLKKLYFITKLIKNAT